MRAESQKSGLRLATVAAKSGPTIPTALPIKLDTARLRKDGAVANLPPF